ncbi:MAG: TetR/AcrR family transcriptional regulator [Geodermatophilaceae bacterium]|nr:TetR/AcrR family transcriptional regulator [Geodermatophilaceae bacterium]
MSRPTDADTVADTEADQVGAWIPLSDAAVHRDDGRGVRPTRRDEILRVAAQLFAERGFHGVGVDDIGAAAGITGPGIYRHFESKDAILAEMLIRISERLLAGGQARVEAANGDPLTALAGLIAWQTDFALSNPALIVVQDRDLANVAEADRRRVRQLQRRYVEVWVGTLTRLHPSTDQAQIRARAHALFGLINSTPHSAGELGPEAMSQVLTDMALAAATSS